MSDHGRSEDHAVIEIERRFLCPMARVVGPTVRAMLQVVRRCRRFSWSPIGLEHLPDGDLPVIFAANHDSHLDTAAILDVLPSDRRARTTVAAAVDTWSADRQILRCAPRRLLEFAVATGFHAFPFDRRGPALPTLQTSRKLIERGWNLLLYPEGTRGEPGHIGEFKAGVGLLAQFTGRPVVPIFVDGGHHLLRVGQWVPNAGHVDVHFGRPMHFDRAVSRSVATERIREAVLALRRAARGEARLEPLVEVAPPREAMG